MAVEKTVREGQQQEEEEEKKEEEEVTTHPPYTQRYYSFYTHTHTHTHTHTRTHTHTHTNTHRAIMCRGGRAMRLSEDHKPNRGDEVPKCCTPPCNPTL